MGRTATAGEMIAAATRLREIWLDLQAEFGLGHVSITYDPSIQERGARGLYYSDGKQIVMGRILDPAAATKTLLHEARHAIQDLRGTLRPADWSWGAVWRREHDAETFALREYSARFAAWFGPLPPYRRWEHKRTLRRGYEERKAAALAY